jgi:hypothetical protein
MSEAIEAIEQCERIMEKIHDVPEAGEDFAASVSEKVDSIWQWIEEHGRVTPKQQEALDNMESGLDRWLERQGWNE